MTTDTLLTLDEIFDAASDSAPNETARSALEDYHTFLEGSPASREAAHPDPPDVADALDTAPIPTEAAVRLYFKQMGRVPLLSKDEEIELAKCIERGRHAQDALVTGDPTPEAIERWEAQVREGQAAREHLAAANTRLVVSIAKKYVGYGLPFLDLIQAGNVGLLKAIDKFDYHRGNKFSTYATWWIRQSITRTLTTQKRTIRLPVHMESQVRTIRQATQRLEQRLGRRPMPEEIAVEIDEEPQKVERILRYAWTPTSLDMPVGVDGEESGTELGDLIEDEETPSPLETTATTMLHETLASLIDGLETREAWVVRRRFGLHGHRQYTLRELGEKLNLTKERVRQIEAKALRKLRRPMGHLQDYR
jgi:RNA polymerase primary sigma factor